MISFSLPGLSMDTNEIAATVTSVMETLRAQYEDSLEDMRWTYDRRLKSLKTTLIRDVTQLHLKGKAELDKMKMAHTKEIASMEKHHHESSTHLILNVGGYTFATSAATLRRIPDSFFTSLLSGRFAIDTLEDGALFIDRDGEHFKHILEYMRDDTLDIGAYLADLPTNVLQILKREFAFYCLDIRNPGPTQTRARLHVIGGLDTYKRSRFPKIVSSVYLSEGIVSTERAYFKVPRERLAMSVLRGRMVFTGGAYEYESGNSLSTIVESYCPVNKAWTDMTPLPEGRCNHTQVTVGDDIYVLGGSEEDFSGYGGISNSVLRLNSTTQTWDEMASLPVGLRYAAACVVNGLIYVFGGRTQNYIATSRVTVYDPARNKWESCPDMPLKRCLHSVTVKDGLCYISGGRTLDNYTGSNRSITDFVDTFDTDTGFWQRIAHLKQKRAGHVSFIWDDKIVVMGGTFNYPTPWATPKADPATSCETYDCDQNEWVPCFSESPALKRSHFHVMVDHTKYTSNIFDDLLHAKKFSN
jgi:N-acetylneuraminic acid mutarotase